MPCGRYFFGVICMLLLQFPAEPRAQKLVFYGLWKSCRLDFLLQECVRRGRGEGGVTGLNRRPDSSSLDVIYVLKDMAHGCYCSPKPSK